MAQGGEKVLALRVGTVVIAPCLSAGVLELDAFALVRASPTLFSADQTKVLGSCGHQLLNHILASSVYMPQHT
eukprot:8040955-Karenia_brevis.AAC.1